MYKKLALGITAVLLMMLVVVPASAKVVYTCGNSDPDGTCPTGEVCQIVGSHTEYGSCLSCGGDGWCNSRSCLSGDGYESCNPTGWCGTGYRTVTVVDDYGCEDIQFTCTPGEYRTQGDCVSSCQSGGGHDCVATCKDCAPECTLDTDCTGQKVCIAGECVNPSCGDGFCNGKETVFTCSEDCGEPQCGTDFFCDPGFQCADNVCSPIPGYCDEDTDCASDEACGSDNQCYDPCTDMQCESYQTCEVVNHNPTCVGDPPDPCADVTCAVGQICDAGNCVDDPDTFVISGHKYNDLNGNGQLDDGEMGLSGWTIEALINGLPVVSAVTDENGFYALAVPIIEQTVENHYDIAEVEQEGWQITYPTGCNWYCWYGLPQIDMTRDFFNHYVGEGACDTDADCEDGYHCDDGQCVQDEQPTCEVDADCPEGYVCEDGQCVAEDDPYACEVDADCEQFNGGRWKCIDGQCRDPPSADYGGFMPYTEPACQNLINSKRPMDDIDPATLPELGLHDTYVSAAFKYASQFDCVAVAYYTRGEPSFDKDCAAAVWYNREQTELHAYGGMPILTAQNPAQAICFLAVKNVANEKSLPVEISITDSFGTKVDPIISSDPVIWKCYALSDEFDECRLRESYDPFQTWRNKPITPVIIEEPVVEEPQEEEQPTCVGLEICDELNFEETPAPEETGETQS